MDNRPANLLHIWFQAIRFPSLTLSLIPVMMGGAFAVIDRAFQSVPFLMALLGSMLIQAGAHLFNDYFDHKLGADREDTLSSNSMIQKGLLTPREVYRGAIVCFALAFILGIYLTAKTGNQVLWFGLLGVLLGYFYTGGSFPLAYRGFGELVVLLALGPLLVLATYYVQVEFFRWTVFCGALPVGILAASIVHAGNLRDRETDRDVGKITLANLCSDKAARHLLSILVLSSYMIQTILALAGAVPWLTLITLLSLPLALTVIKRTQTSASPPELNLVAGLTVLLHLVYGVAYTMGLYGSVLFS